MAPPSTRRPGFSRRAQYGLFLGYVLAVGGILFAALLLVVAAIDPRGFSALKGAALDVTVPISAGGRSVTGAIGNMGSTVSDYIRAGRQNAGLRRELEAQRLQLVEAQAATLENQRLKAMLALAGETGDQVAVARIVGSSFDSSRRLATISAGSSAGVRPGQPVRAPEGLIGRVLETGRWASRILLITDGMSNVPVQLVRDGTPAIATGRGDGLIDLKTLEVGTNPFRPGDILVTSGTGGVFAPNIPVAIVRALDGDSAIARPLADPARIDIAMVQRVYQPAANAPLNEAVPPAPPPPMPAALPVPAPGEGSPTPAPQDPRYQPGLQSPPPGVRVAQPPPQPQPQAQPAAPAGGTPPR